MGDLVVAALLGLAVAMIVLDLARKQRSWQLVACGVGFLGFAFGSLLTPWLGLGGVAVAAFLVAFLHGSRPRRTQRVPLQREAMTTPEPASNLRVL